MKTILFHIHALLGGGIEKVLIELLQSLPAEKYNIRLSISYNMGELEVFKGRIPKHVEVCYILDKPVYNTPKKKKTLGKISITEKILSELFLPPFKRLVHIRKIKEIVKDVDVVIDFDMTLSGYYKLLAGKKKIAYSHFSLRHYWGGNGNKGKRDALARRLGHYEKIITISDEMRSDAIRLYPWLTPKVVRLYNALNYSNISTAAKAVVSGYDNMFNSDFFLTVGRLTETQKDFTTVIKGYAASVKKYGISPLLVIAGEGPDKGKLQSLCESEGVGDRVHFIGFQSNPYPWMKKAKLFLFGSKNEGLPTVLIEALFLGAPIIATACPTGVKEILMYGKAGMLIPVGDHDAMCEAIHELSVDTSLLRFYSANSKDVLKEFDINTVIKQFEEIIDN